MRKSYLLLSQVDLEAMREAVLAVPLRLAAPPQRDLARQNQPLAQVIQ